MTDVDWLQTLISVGLQSLLSVSLVSNDLWDFFANGQASSYRQHFNQKIHEFNKL